MNETTAYITPDSLSTGSDELLSLATFGRRGVAFVRTHRGQFAVCVVSLDQDGRIEHVRGAAKIRDHEIPKLEVALTTASRAFGASGLRPR